MTINGATQPDLCGASCDTQGYAVRSVAREMLTSISVTLLEPGVGRWVDVFFARQSSCMRIPVNYVLGTAPSTGQPPSAVLSCSVDFLQKHLSDKLLN